ncbi:MAG: butyrate kinase [Lentimicrobiaceae bacterium]|jgi:butyrate kinase|nr:butyrate kinase [Lentimicrobiaceae bacterium]MCP4910415.1 butyrate kinase [Bacteroidota bacterium]MBT3455156.1 butyrate kinase [Lentimicrobiaceae bacterium]MBT3819384.1 butyrate kinase [Lentimicrobiaceae bacterium]MBT4060920.1 butyrate kinase [Lentimicrobiaceae bacterium]
METRYILAINPGSTSTKIAVYADTTPVFIQTISHTSEELAIFELVTDQFNFRKNLILEELKSADIVLKHIRVIMGRGGLLKPVESGIVEVNKRMISDLESCSYGEHASNLGGLISYDLAHSLPNAKAYITNPVVVDEMDDLARLSGHPLLPRRSVFHALNQKAVAREHSKSIMKKYEDLNLIVVHLGGGITVGAHKKGRVVDVNQGLDGDGPYSPERTGTLPVGDLVRLCFSGKYSQNDILRMINGEGGLVAYLGTNSAYEVEQRISDGDSASKYIYDGMAYQISKEIGAMVAVLKSNVDGILITGGIAYDKYFVNQIISYVNRFAPVHVYPGEDEMKALAMNGLRLLNGEVKARSYS